MQKQFFLTGLIAVCCHCLLAQQVYPVTDTKPVIVDGLEMGYNIRSKEQKTVGDKGDFSRYSLHFYVTNTTSQAKIILYKQGLTLLQSTSDQIVQFNCLNATGARLTTKSALLQAPPCNVTAKTDDYDCNTKKTIKNTRLVQIGYWIKPGQTITTDGIVIVPLNEQPNVQAVYLASSVQYLSSAAIGQTDAPQQVATPAFNAQGFSRIRNTSENTFINVETGILRTSFVQSGWWSADWQVIPIPGTNAFNIKNRWKGHYIGAERGSLAMLADAQYPAGAWVLEPTQNANVYNFKNVASGTYLGLSSGQMSLVPTSDFRSLWSLQ